MGIYDRDYIQTNRSGGNPVAWILQSAVGTLIFFNVVLWFLQVLTRPGRGGLHQAPGSSIITELFAARPSEVFGFQTIPPDGGFGFHLWKLLTANFVHSTDGIAHLLFNMLILFVFGRELERLYGRASFYFLYLVAGVIAVAAEVLALGLSDHDNAVLGASGAVMAVVVLYALHFPQRTVLVMFVIPMPVWLLCVLIVGADLLGVISPAPGDTVAHLAHLAGAGYGFLFRYYDLRWERFARLARGGSRGRGRSRPGKVLSFPGRRREPPAGSAEDPVSVRIDALLGKISAEGKDSLTDEEWDFLKDNSGRYRSR